MMTRVVLDGSEDGKKCNSAHDQERLSAKFFFRTIVDIVSIFNVGGVFLVLRLRATHSWPACPTRRGRRSTCATWWP